MTGDRSCTTGTAGQTPQHDGRRHRQCASTSHRARQRTQPTGRPRKPWSTTRSRAGACSATECSSSRTRESCCRTAGS
ncbi:hypothetical protein AN219_07040, partial [Streptomyces nanshensis]